MFRVVTVITLIHIQISNDARLAKLVDGIDIILRGQDHDYEVKKVKMCSYNNALVMQVCSYKAKDDYTIFHS